ncbi:hypothetical protein CLF_104317, partial [Clonorchis sinensis]
PALRTDHSVRLESAFRAASVRHMAPTSSGISELIFKPPHPVHLAAFNICTLKQAGQQAALTLTLDSAVMCPKIISIDSCDRIPETTCEGSHQGSEWNDIVLIFEEEEEVQVLLDELTKIIPSFGMHFAPTKCDTEDELAFRKMRNRCKAEIRRWSIRKQTMILSFTRKNKNVLLKPTTFLDRNMRLTSDPVVGDPNIVYGFELVEETSRNCGIISGWPNLSENSLGTKELVPETGPDEKFARSCDYRLDWARGCGRDFEENSCGSAITLGMTVPCHHCADMLRFMDSPVTVIKGAAIGEGLRNGHQGCRDRRRDAQFRGSWIWLNMGAHYLCISKDYSLSEAAFMCRKKKSRRLPVFLLRFYRKEKTKENSYVFGANMQFVISRSRPQATCDRIVATTLRNMISGTSCTTVFRIKIPEPLILCNSQLAAKGNRRPLLYVQEGNFALKTSCPQYTSERQPLNDKNKTYSGNLGESLDPVYQMNKVKYEQVSGSHGPLACCDSDGRGSQNNNCSTCKLLFSCSVSSSFSPSTSVTSLYKKFVLLNYTRYRPLFGSNVTLRLLLSDRCCDCRNYDARLHNSDTKTCLRASGPASTMSSTSTFGHLPMSPLTSIASTKFTANVTDAVSHEHLSGAAIEGDGTVSCPRTPDLMTLLFPPKRFGFKYLLSQRYCKALSRTNFMSSPFTLRLQIRPYSGCYIKPHVALPVRPLKSTSNPTYHVLALILIYLHHPFIAPEHHFRLPPPLFAPYPPLHLNDAEDDTADDSQFNCMPSSRRHSLPYTEPDTPLPVRHCMTKSDLCDRISIPNLDKPPNYDGIHYTTLLMRTLERLVKDPLTKFFLASSAMDDPKYGFLSQKSVSGCLLHFFEITTAAYDAGHSTVIVCLDIQKARIYLMLQLNDYFYPAWSECAVLPAWFFPR